MFLVRVIPAVQNKKTTTQRKHIMFEEQKRIMKIKLETQRKTLSDKIKTAGRHIPTFQIIL